MNKHLKCEQLFKDTNKEYKKLINSLNGLLSGEITANEVNKTAENVFERVDNLIENYEAKKG
ncbi:MAG: hypothetical protein ACLRZ9_05685 [Eubacterium sp.]